MLESNRWYVRIANTSFTCWYSKDFPHSFFKMLEKFSTLKASIVQSLHGSESRCSVEDVSIWFLIFINVSPRYQNLRTIGQQFISAIQPSYFSCAWFWSLTLLERGYLLMWVSCKFHANNIINPDGNNKNPPRGCHGTARHRHQMSNVENCLSTFRSRHHWRLYAAI